MAKSKIIKDLVNDEISIEIALNRTKIITNELNNNALEKWINSEVLGYDTSDIPSYRN